MMNFIFGVLFCGAIVLVSDLMKRYEIKIDKETDRINRDPKSYVNGIVPEIYK